MIWLLRIVPFLKSYGLAIAAAALLATVAVYVRGAERAKGSVDALEDDIAQCIQANAQQAEVIANLNSRIRESNTRWLEMVARERDRLKEAQAQAEQLRQQRDAITGQLAQSRLQFAEDVEHDPDLAQFVDQRVPGAVWDRLRRASGDTAR